MIYRYGGTIGGTSITARIIYNKTGFPLSQSYLYTDLAIIALAGVVFTMETALLAALTLILVGLFSERSWLRPTPRPGSSKLSCPPKISAILTPRIPSR